MRRRGSHQVAALEHDFARHAGGRLWHEPHEGEHADALARAGLADDRDRFAVEQVVADAVDRLGDPTLRAEMHGEVAHRQHRLVRRRRSAHADCPRDSMTDF